MRYRVFKLGQLIKDREVKRIDGRPVAVDHLTNATEDATEEEASALAAEERETAQREARARLLAALEQYKEGQPWGIMLHDLAVVLGLVDP